MGHFDQQAYFAAVKDDLGVFLQQAFRTIYPGKLFLHNWHVDAIVYALELSIVGERPRLVINLPPRQLKSFLTSVVLPAYILGFDPTAKIICISYSDELARALSRDFRRIVESTWYRRLFTNVRRAKLTENEFATDQGGLRFATSVGGTLTGRGGDFVIIDDPIKPDDALSDKVRDSTNEWYRSTVLSRLDDKRRSVLILVMQRLHVNDLTGFVDACGGFHKLSFPAIAHKDEYIPVSDTDIYHRLAGEPLHEEREDLATLERIRDEIGPINFAAQYQQRPECPDGAMFKLKWLRFDPRPPRRLPDGMITVSIDTALSTSNTADYSAISIVYSDHTGHYVCHADRGRWDYETLRRKSMRYVELLGKDINFVIEAAGAGTSLIYSLRGAGYRCFHHFPKDDKMVRANYAVPIVHNGRLHIVDQPSRNSWVEPFVTELLSFPHCRFDDQVDSIVQMLPWAEGRVNPGANYLHTVMHGGESV